MTEWSQGVTGDGPVILKDGRIAHIDEIVAALQHAATLAEVLTAMIASSEKDQDVWGAGYRQALYTLQHKLDLE